ncbi:MAG TPA: alginate lyase family protein [Bryobacteraceae bacterium]|nr:alginate lyase family protein [Bryobacteraceae bacterium]
MENTRDNLLILMAGICFCAAPALAQSTHQSQVCDPSSCTLIDTSVMGGLRFEDYKVTNPKAVQFDPATRSVELAQLGTSTAQTLCQAPLTFDTPAPTIVFNNVQAQIRYNAGSNGSSDQQFLDVEFANFSASNGYSSPSFGLKMTRNVASNGAVASQFSIGVHAGNPGLENVVGLVGEVGYSIDPVNLTASVYGNVPSDLLLRQTVFGVLANVYTILKGATFSTTNSPPAGRTLWTASDIIALAQLAQPLIAAAPDLTVPIGPPFKCTYPTYPNAYAVCSGMDQMNAFENTMLQWGGEYLGLGTSQSRKILTRNLLAWAQANAPPLDPQPNDLNDAFQYSNMELSKPILMLWPTLRDDPALAAADRQTIENWIVNRLMPVAYVPGGVGGDYPYRNSWGYFGASIQMADAIRRSDNQTFANAIQEFYVALNQMRPDGSLPYETSRGPCSVTYTNVAILQLTSIAEMAATQGYDLYAMNVNGKNLEAAIEYLLNARDNPSLLSQYANASGTYSCFLPSNAPLDFSDVFNNYVPSQLAWMEGYLARFPFSTTAARLRQIVGSNLSAPPFPMWADYTGVNSTCSFRKAFEFTPVTGVKIAIGGGNNQTVAPNQVTPARLGVRVTDGSGKPLVNVLVSFAMIQGSANVVAPAQVLTDASGLASAIVTAGPLSGTAIVTAAALGASVSFTVHAAAGPVLQISATHQGNFVLGQAAAAYTIMVENHGTAATSGMVTVTDTVPGGLTATAIGGPGWTCDPPSFTCMRSDILANGSSFPPITVTVSVASNAASPATNSVAVSGGGSPSAAATDPAILIAQFTDIAPTDLAYLPAIDLLREYGVTGGCGANPPAYCPATNIPESQMAVFVTRSIFGGDDFPYTQTPYFSDAPASNQYFQWIQKEQELGIAVSCSATQFCPDSAVTRGIMAVLIVRSRYGMSMPVNYPAAPYFTDVPSTHPYFPWIQKMAQLGITSGCGPTTYCPDDPVTREQMAVFIMRGEFNQLLPANVPIVVWVSPGNASAGQTVKVTIAGQNTSFSQASQVTAGAGITVSNVNVVSSTLLTAQLTVAAGAASRPRPITVTTGTEEATLPSGFTVQ